MARPTDPAGSIAVADFYDALAPDYDRMTDFGRRFVAEKPFFKLLVDKYGIKSAIDAGAGSGFHSLLLAQIGVAVTAVDVSAEMLSVLKKHAVEMKLEIETAQSSFQRMSRLVSRKVDAVFCLGNTLPHLQDQNELEESLLSFRVLLRPGGLLFMQILNYKKILAQRERVLNVKEEGDAIYVRFYDYDDPLIHFNILKLTRISSGWESGIRTVSLMPWRSEDLLHGLERVGFVDTKLFGAISQEPFIPERSKDLVILSSSTR